MGCPLILDVTVSWAQSCVLGDHFSPNK